MFRALKILVTVATFLFLVVLGYAFFGDLSAPLDSITEPVPIEAN